MMIKCFQCGEVKECTLLLNASNEEHWYCGSCYPGAYKTRLLHQKRYPERYK